MKNLILAIAMVLVASAARANCTLEEARQCARSVDCPCATKDHITDWQTWAQDRIENIKKDQQRKKAEACNKSVAALDEAMVSLAFSWSTYYFPGMQYSEALTNSVDEAKAIAEQCYRVDCADHYDSKEACFRQWQELGNLSIALPKK